KLDRKNLTFGVQFSSSSFKYPNHHFYFKKDSDSVDFYCNILKFEISRIALNQGFFVSNET
ncbi:hypothetical protein, partial [Streptococcus sp. HMSC062D07]|uniref:hypothetical protein n=1 Tax=Streptococcus sp. HMSC062D07 TaxID=1739461 RepID=UPI001C99013E